MELEHAFQQSGFVSAMQLMLVTSLLAPGVAGRMDVYSRLVGAVASIVVSYGPMAVLLYVLYRVSHLS